MSTLPLWFTTVGTFAVVVLIAVLITPRKLFNEERTYADLMVATLTVGISFVALLVAAAVMTAGSNPDVLAVGGGLLFTFPLSCLAWAIAFRLHRRHQGLTITPATAVFAGFLGGILAGFITLWCASIVIGTDGLTASTGVAVAWGAGLAIAAFNLVMATVAGILQALKIHRSGSHLRREPTRPPARITNWT